QSSSNPSGATRANQSALQVQHPMNAKSKTVVLCVVSGIVIGGVAVWGFLSRDENSIAFDRTAGTPVQPSADQARQSPSTSYDPAAFAQIARAQMERAAAQSRAAD